MTHKLKHSKFILFTLLVFALSAFANPSIAQKKKKKNDTVAPAKKKGPEKDYRKKKISDQTKNHQKIDGLFTFYRDSISGGLKMMISEDQLNKEFIHFYYFENGITQGRMNKGSFRGSKIFKIKKYYDKIEFVGQNSRFYFDPENPLSRAADANVSNAILFSGNIKAGNEKVGQYLIEVDELFLKDVLGVIDITAFSKKPDAFKLGSLSKTKTKYRDIRNYENNSDIIVDYSFVNKKPNPISSDAITDLRNITVTVQHSFIEVPDNNYKPRYDDPRVGYFTTKVTDMTSKEAIAYKDLVHRWNLEKKDPSAAISEPVEPITWWIENTTPFEFRESIKKGVLAWNVAFEQAGFKNAMAVKVQPDDADWDAGDLNYNVLRWTSSEDPPFGGYGPSFVNPRTGQILGADIMLEYIHHTYRVRYSELFGDAVSELLDEHGTESDMEHQFCYMGDMMHTNTMFGRTALLAENAAADELSNMQEEAMIALIMHEVGHTLGLNHNMKASQLFSPEQLADKEFIKGKCLTGSVMDYAAINLTLDREKQGQYYDVAVGPYDVWAIQFGYSNVSDDELNKILSRSTEPELIFGNDADDMRSSSRGIDPRVMVSDLSNDQIGYSISQIKLVNNLMNDIKKKYTKDGESYQELRQAYNVLNRIYSTSGVVMSRFIGGVYVDRAMAGQENAAAPYTPVEYEKQKSAMDAISKYIFSPSAFAHPNELYNYLARQRRGFNFFPGPEDPKIHNQVLGSQKRTLDHLLHKNTLQRISDSQLYGNKYSLSEYMKDLNDAIFKADAYKSVNSFRQNLQIEYVKKLINIFDEKSSYTNLAKSSSLYQLKAIQKIASGSYGDTATKAHRQHVKYLIEQALDKK